MATVVEPAERVILIVGDRKLVTPKLEALGYTKIRPVTFDLQTAEE
jgi:hypothetical protein